MNLLDIEKPEIPDTLTTEVGQRLKTKTGWQPSYIQPHKSTELSFLRDDVVRKCLALGLELEIPVGEFALEGERKLEGMEEYSLALKSNAHDENVHFEGISYASNAYGASGGYILDEAKTLADLLISMDHVHPVYMAGYIELGIFMPVLTMLRCYGNSALKLLARDITRDEGVHVFTNWSIIDELNIDVPSAISSKLTELRKEIISWLVCDSGDKKKDLVYWIKQSEDLINKRVAPDLGWTRSGTYTAFFEIPNSVSKY